MSQPEPRTQPARTGKETVTARVRRAYGAHPWHLVLVLAGFAVIASLVVTAGLSTFWNPQVWWQSILVWFLGAVIVHDLVLFPLYATADRAVAAASWLGRRVAGGQAGRRSVPVLNYIRLPALATGLVTLLFLPGIIEQGTNGYMRATGQTQEPFDERWLLLCAAFFAAAALAYVVRVVVVRRRAGGPRGTGSRDDDRG